MKSLALVLLAATSASAQTRITYTGTIDSSSPSNIGQAVTFELVTSGNAAAAFVGSQFEDETVGTDADLFSSFSGTGVTGGWVRPSSVPGAPYSAVQIRQSNPLVMDIYIGNDDSPYQGRSGTLGFLFLGNPVYEAEFSVSTTANGLGQFAAGTDYSTVFQPFHGTYSLAPSSYAYFTALVGGVSQTYNFSLNSMTISAVPEPSTYGLLLGGLALAGAALRRRRAKA